eukprot:TRINITY_DN4322_c0_g2_i1.p1 TRINITY_DN4322_c0_g2~~TRINITY_DN4322_c0_g2_i1.p1  ORF type:complete len:268 (+),score=67.56 TRINITY_DN4322_c0_g2_i1:2-805(+)
MFDVPGMTFTSESERELLKRLLAGLQDHQHVAYQGLTMQDVEALQGNPENCIDFVLWVIKASLLEKNSFPLLGAQVTTNARDYYHDVFRLIKENSVRGLYPLLVYTHKDLSRLTQQQLAEEAFPWLPPHSKFMISNYLKPGEYNFETDRVALSLLHSLFTVRTAHGPRPAHPPSKRRPGVVRRNDSNNDTSDADDRRDDDEGRKRKGDAPLSSSSVATMKKTRMITEEQTNIPTIVVATPHSPSMRLLSTPATSSSSSIAIKKEPQM